MEKGSEHERCGRSRSGRSRGLIGAALAAIAMSGCGASTRPGAVVTVPATRSLACHGPTGLVAWKPDGQHDQPTLDRWCASVGPPVVDVAEPSAAHVRRLLVVSWNVGVGAGRLAALVDLLRARAAKPVSGDVGLVVLLQEVFRGGADIPEGVPAGVDAPGAIRPERPAPDIVEVAKTLGMSLVYVPSMRNGPATSRYEREDRGNAILSTEPLTDVTAFELPFAKQRRVAVAATVTVRGSGGSKVRVVTAHLDTPGRGTIGQARTLAEFIASAKGDVPLVLGIDTNALLGRSGAVVGQLEAGAHAPAFLHQGSHGTVAVRPRRFRLHEPARRDDHLRDADRPLRIPTTLPRGVDGRVVTRSAVPRSARFSRARAAGRRVVGMRFPRMAALVPARRSGGAGGDRARATSGIVSAAGAAAAAAATGRIVTAAQALVATLDDAGKAKVQFPFDGPQKTRWSNFPTGIYERQGLRMGDLTPPQKAAVLALLGAALSSDGYRKVMEIVRGDEVLRKAAAEAGRPVAAPPAGGPGGQVDRAAG